MQAIFKDVLDLGISQTNHETEQDLLSTYVLRKVGHIYLETLPILLFVPFLCFSLRLLYNRTYLTYLVGPLANHSHSHSISTRYLTHLPCCAFLFSYCSDFGLLLSRCTYASLI